MAVVAGQKLRVSDLTGVGGTGYKELGSDLTANNTTSFQDVSDLNTAVVANARYGFDGWMMWNADPTADIKFGWTTPASTTGWWSTIGPVASPAPIAGAERQNYGEFGVVPIGTSLGMAGDDTAPTIIRICAIVRGQFVTTNAGTLRLRMAQNSAVASDTILRSGSWLNVFRLA